MGYAKSVTAVVVACAAIPLAALLFQTALTVWSTAAPSSDFGDGSMFDRIAPRYDLVNRFLALNLDTAWRRTMVDELLNRATAVDGGETKSAPLRLIDLATGTADVAVLVAEALAERGFDADACAVEGVDPSDNMLAVGRDKVARRGLTDVVTLSNGDARALTDLATGRFRGATMAFGVRNVPSEDRGTALCEIRRVLEQPDGRGTLAILEFSEPDADAGVLGALARAFIRHVVPVAGAALSGAPREYLHLQNSIKDFPSPAEFARQLGALSCPRRKGFKGGGFRVDEVRQMNFGSVQLYLATTV